jgi:type IV pilus assembly protein PilC
MIGFYPFEQALNTIESDILHGRLLNQSMAQFPVFDKRMLALTRIAEEVNKLDKVFAKLNTQYSEELEHQIGLIGSVLEPTMIVIVGILVAVILISMYLPLFQLSTSIM